MVDEYIKTCIEQIISIIKNKLNEDFIVKQLANLSSYAITSEKSFLTMIFTETVDIFNIIASLPDYLRNNDENKYVIEEILQKSKSLFENIRDNDFNQKENKFSIYQQLEFITFKTEKLAFYLDKYPKPKTKTLKFRKVRSIE